MPSRPLQPDTGDVKARSTLPCREWRRGRSTPGLYSDLPAASRGALWARPGRSAGEGVSPGGLEGGSTKQRRHAMSTLALGAGRVVVIETHEKGGGNSYSEGRAFGESVVDSTGGGK